MDPLMATMYGNPMSMSGTTADMLLPFVQQYSNYVNQADLYSDLSPSLFAGGCLPTYPTVAAQNGNVTRPEGFDMGAHLAQIAEQQMKMNEYNHNRMIQERQEGLMNAAPLERLGTAAMDLKTKIVENEQEQIPQALAVYLQAVREAYDPEGTAEEEIIMTRARTLYKEQTGNDLILDIKEHGHGSFLQGFINGATFDIFGQRTADETVSQITGQDVSTTSKNLKKAGNTVGCTAAGAGVGAAVGGIIGAILGCGAASAATAPAGALLGAKIGAGIGTVVGLIKNIF